jgi:endonuclease/exonuclease/phosphatase family metal-dependent hydrolase
MEKNPSHLKVMVLNAQDLFLFMDKHKEDSIHELTEIKWQLMSSSLFSNKSKEKCLLLGQTIMDSGADIVMMTEVGGAESLANFAKFILADQYLALSLPSNSDRGIDLGYLVKKELAFKVEIHSHIDFPLPLPAKRFSRDVLRLDLKHNGNITCIFLLVHIKSKLDLKRADFEGRTRRELEVKGLVDIYKDLLHHQVPILVGGDFNGHAGEKDTEEEFRPIYAETDLKDIAYLAQLPDEERFSYIYFNRGGNRFVQQIDYLFISEKYAHLLVPSECFFPRYRHLNGGPLPIPKRIEHKNTLPSDHYPFLATLKLNWGP